MAPSKKKAKKQSTELQRLLEQLRAWFRAAEVASSSQEDGSEVAPSSAATTSTGNTEPSRLRVCEFVSAEQAATAVASTVRLPSVSYEASLNGWWKWYQQTRDEGPNGILTAAATTTNTSSHKSQLEQEALDAAKTVAQAAAKNPQDVQLARLSWPAPNITRTISGEEQHSPHQPETGGNDDDDDLWNLLQQLLPSPGVARTRIQAQQQSKALAAKLWPCLEHDNGPDAPFDYIWREASTGRVFWKDVGTGPAGLAQLIRKLWELADNVAAAITLSLRIKEDSPLDRLCRKRLDDRFQMSQTICPANTWCVGPPTTRAAVQSEANAATVEARLPAALDPRYFLILGTPGALTKSHWDRGVQTVLYHTVAGTNHALAVPRQAAQMLHAVDEGISSLLASCSTTKAHGLVAWSDALERRVLKECQDVVQAATFEPGETMLILPAGGHAILTGNQGKVVIAGEWHLRTDI